MVQTACQEASLEGPYMPRFREREPRWNLVGARVPKNLFTSKAVKFLQARVEIQYKKSNCFTYGGKGNLLLNDATLLQRRIHFKLWILGNFPDTGEACQHINHVRNGGFRLVFLHLNLPHTAEATEYHSALPERFVLNWKEMCHLQELQYHITIFPLFPISSAHLTFLFSISEYNYSL